MNTKAETGPGGALDTVKLVAATLVLLAGFVGYYWFAEASILLRVLGLVATLVAGVVIAFQSSQGRQLWQFIQGSQVEIRKVVWPTQQETVNTTLVVIVFTIVMAAFFFVVDFLLLNITQFFTGRGG
jgi:preprotein translocase subunit SecE